MWLVVVAVELGGALRPLLYAAKAVEMGAGRWPAGQALRAALMVWGGAAGAVVSPGWWCSVDAVSVPR